MNNFFLIKWILNIWLVQKNAKVVTIDSYEDVPAYDDKALQKAAANQPISVAIEASGRDFQFYESVKLLTRKQNANSIIAFSTMFKLSIFFHFCS